MGRNERDRDERTRSGNQGRQDRGRRENRDPNREEWRDTDRSGGGMSGGWHGQDRDEGYSGGMGSWGGERRDTHWGARDQYGQGSEGWNREDEQWGGRGQDLGRGERGPEPWAEDRDERWRGRERGDEWRDQRSGWNRGGGQDWSQHTANWDEGSGTGKFRGREGGWGGYGAYDRESSRHPGEGGTYNRGRTEERPQYGEGRGYSPGYKGATEWSGRPASSGYGPRDRDAVDPRYGAAYGAFQNTGRGMGTGSRDDEAQRAHEGRRGPHTGRGPRNYQRSDERIHEDLIQRLTDHPDVDASEIDVEVKEGVVTLRGSVDERRAKHLAEDIADAIWGVKDVRNEIRVQRNIETGTGSGSAAFHEGSTNYPTLTAPGGREPDKRHPPERHATGMEEGSNAGEGSGHPRRDKVSSGDQGIGHRS